MGLKLPTAPFRFANQGLRVSKEKLSETVFGEHSSTYRTSNVTKRRKCIRSAAHFLHLYSGTFFAGNDSTFSQIILVISAAHAPSESSRWKFSNDWKSCRAEDGECLTSCFVKLPSICVRRSNWHLAETFSTGNKNEHRDARLALTRLELLPRPWSPAMQRIRGISLYSRDREFVIRWRYPFWADSCVPRTTRSLQRSSVR